MIHQILAVEAFRCCSAAVAHLLIPKVKIRATKPGMRQNSMVTIDQTSRPPLWYWEDVLG